MLAGCAYLQLQYEANLIRSEIVVIRGVLHLDHPPRDPVVVVLSRDQANGGPYQVDFQLLYDSGPFYFAALPGTYRLAAFEDSGGGINYAPGDPAVLLPTPLVATRGKDLTGIEIHGPFRTDVRLDDRFDLTGSDGRTQLSLSHRNLGEVVSLGDPRLSSEMGQAGLWRPGEYLLAVESGIFFLQPYDAKKIPVLFIHGIGGAPIQFAEIIESLDHERFQPWVFAYPSAFPLEFLGDALGAMLQLLERRYAFEQIHLVAHSMGGLVARAYLREAVLNHAPQRVGLFVSLATPWGGHEGARLYPGTDPRALDHLRAKTDDENEPAPQPLRSRPDLLALRSGNYPHLSWLDMAPESEFLSELYDVPLPPNVRFHLIFAFLGSTANWTGTAGDGVVSLASELRPAAQKEAVGEFGFELDHDALLVSPEVKAYLRKLFSEPLLVHPNE